MFDVVMDFLKRLFRSRLIFVMIIYGALFGVLIHQLFRLQISNRTDYVAPQQETKEVTREIRPTRGCIYDRNGVLLAYNELCYSITYQDTGELKDSAKINEMILRLLSLLDEYHCELVTQFPIRLNAAGEPEFAVSGNSLTRFLKDAYSTETPTEEQMNADAKTVFEFLCYDKSVNSPRFAIPEELSREDALRVLSIRFAVFVNRYAANAPTITIAQNVSMQAVAAIQEYSPELPGVAITQETLRRYNYGETIAHIVGYTGTITQDQLEEKQAAGDKYYSASDAIGKTGIEAELEEELRGEKGIERVLYDENGKVLSVTTEKEPVPGHDVYLTIDVELTKQMYDVLENHLAGILLSKIHMGSDHGSRGESSGEITIPIYDVYNALIKNNIIDYRHFTAEDATDREKAVQSMYESKRAAVMEQLKVYMAQNSTVKLADLPEREADYLTHIYDVLADDGVLDTGAMDRTDPTYRQYRADKIGLSQFLIYAFSKSWIRLDKLQVKEGSYYDTGELYELLLSYTWDLLEDDHAFAKLIYSDLIYSYTLSGRTLCLLLFDQGVLEEDSVSMRQLEEENLSAFGFMTRKIRSLEITPADLALEPCSGSIVVTEVDTGQVEVMVSYPSYDCNRMANTVDAEYYAKMYDNLSAPFYNRATYTRLAPGSTFKIVSTTAALEEGVVSTSEEVEDQVIFTDVNPSPRCWVSPHSHGLVDVTTAIEVSCNYFFYEMAYRLGSKNQSAYNDARGLDALIKYAKMFCLDQKSGVEIGEIEPKISDDDAIRSAIGQGTNAFAPVQLARYVTTIANRGTVFELTLVKEIHDAEDHLLRENKAAVVNRMDAVSDSTWSVIRNGMYRVVNGRHSSVDELFADLTQMGVSIAGKTGTAQQNEYHPNHSWFLSYTPFDDPQISTTVLIPNGYGSTNAVELTADLYKIYYKAGNYQELLEHRAIDPKSSATTD